MLDSIWLGCFASRYAAPIAAWFERGARYIAPKTLYILNEDGDPWQASMICPCGCGAVLEMNLIADEKAVWRAKIEKDGTGTLHPSVWRQVGCRSHFFIRNGKIRWCE